MLPPHGALRGTLQHHAVQHRRLGCLEDVILVQLPASKDEPQAFVRPALGASDLQGPVPNRISQVSLRILELSSLHT